MFAQDMINDEDPRQVCPVPGPVNFILTVGDLDPDFVSDGLDLFGVESSGFHFKTVGFRKANPLRLGDCQTALCPGGPGRAENENSNKRSVQPSFQNE